jgi:hypothetical protein
MHPRSWLACRNVTLADRCEVDARSLRLFGAGRYIREEWRELGAVTNDDLLGLRPRLAILIQPKRAKCVEQHCVPTGD